MNYDRISSVYDSLAFVASLGNIRSSQIANLDNGNLNGKVLVIGGGTGWIIPYILKSEKPIELYYVEASRSMLDLAMDNCLEEYRARTNFILGDENKLPDIQFDAVITNFFLDCFKKPRMENIIEALLVHLKEGGNWYITDFRIDEVWYRKLWQIPYVTLMIIFFKVSTQLEANKLQPFEDYFDGLPLKNIDTKYFLGKLIFSAIYERVTPAG